MYLQKLGAIKIIGGRLGNEFCKFTGGVFRCYGFAHGVIFVTKPDRICFVIIGGSAITPASAARNCAVDRRIAEPIGVTDVRVQ